MRKPIYVLTCAVLSGALLFSCHSHTTAGAAQSAIDSSSFTNLDTALALTNELRPDNYFAPVYELSPQTIAITFTIPDDGPKSILDTVFTRIFDEDSLIYSGENNRESKNTRNTSIIDTTGFFWIMRDTRLEAELKKYIDTSYYIYGSKGIAECKVKNVVYFFGACAGEYYAITLEGYDKEKCGHPLFSYPGLLPLQYHNNYKGIQDWMNEEKTAEINDSSSASYKDHIYPVVFANIDSTYFAYSDDFKWTAKRDTMAACLFPQRMIIKTRGQISPGIMWASFFDNFGVPCD